MNTIETTIPEDAWQAIMSRDRAFDGVLFYAVRTTGVYCRPSCPSRRPKRTNVLVFDSADRAEASGFRACHRCQPQSASGTTTERRVRLAMEYLATHRDQSVTLEQLGAAVGLSPFHLQRKFKEVVGATPREYQKAQRLDAMRSHLRNGTDVGRAVWAAGYGSVSGAYDAVAKSTTMTPGEYRRGAAGVPVSYSVHSTRFGQVLVASTQKGVCAVLLGDDSEQLIRDLSAEFPAAVLSEAEPDSGTRIRDFIAYLEGKHSRLTLPLDLHGSTFQLRVWKALQEIPAGETRTYSDVARAIGEPKSARAVARACASNKTAVVVPCHRVVRSDGSLSGYRWGPDRKRRLLQMEQDIAATPRAE